MIRRVLPFAAVTAIALVVWLPTTELRFEAASLNYLFVCGMAIAWPSTLLWLSLGLRTLPMRAAGVVAAIVLALPCEFVAIAAGLGAAETAHAGPRADTPQELTIGSGTNTVYRLYTTDCGALCRTYTLKLRKETSLVPGLKTVTSLWSKLRSPEATLRMAGDVITIEAVDGSFSADIRPDEH